MQNKKGFTIIELIVVIAIIAILAAIVMVSVTHYITESKIVSAKAEMREWATSATKFYIDNGGTFSGFSMSPEASRLSVSIPTLVGASGLDVCSIGNGFCFRPGAGTLNFDWCVDSTGYAGPSGVNLNSSGGCFNSGTVSCRTCNP